MGTKKPPTNCVCRSAEFVGKERFTAIHRRLISDSIGNLDRAIALPTSKRRQMAQTRGSTNAADASIQNDSGPPQGPATGPVVG